MAKFAGLVTYVVTKETVPGVWAEVAESVTMRGDIIRKGAVVQNGDKVNDDVVLNHRVSLVADDYALGNYQDIKRIQIDGREWNINNIEVQRPRIIVTVGGLWNGN